MRFRAVVALAFLVLATPIWADDADVPKLASALGSGDSAAQIQAADDLGELGHHAKAAVPALVKALGSKDAQVQWHVAAALAEIGPDAKDAVPALAAALKSSEAQVRGHSAHALQEIGTASQAAVPQLSMLLNDNDKDVRRAGLDALVGIGLKPDVLVPILRRALEGNDMDPSLTVPALVALAQSGDQGIQVLIEELKNDKARYWACIALAEAGPKAKAAVPDLAKLVASKEPELRMQAIMALGEIGGDSKSVVPAIIKSLNDDQPSVRFAAAYALGKIGDKSANAELTKQLDSKDHFLQLTSAWALAKINPNDNARVDSTVKLLVDSLKDKDKFVREAAARGLFELHLPSERVTPVLAELLADEDPVIRTHVADAMASLGEKALPRLIKALENDKMQALAVEVIHRLGPKAKSAVPALILELKDPDPAYRREVEFALAAIGPDASGAVPALLDRLKNDEPKVRYTACYALGKIGPGAAAAIPALRENLTSEDKFLKVTSVWALLRIQPEDQPLRGLALPLLIKALEETDRDLVKEEVANALGTIGPTAIAAVPILEKTAKETESDSVRKAAEEALKKIHGGK